MIKQNVSIHEVITGLMDAYAEKQRTISRVTGIGSKKRRAHMSPEWQSSCASLRDEYGARLHDLLMVCCKATGDASFTLPTPITEQLLGAVGDYLEEQGQESRNRIANYKTVLRALTAESASRILGPGSHEWLHQPRCPRSLNADPGTFHRLEEDLADWAELASAPLKNSFEERDPIQVARITQISRFMLCATTLLHQVGSMASKSRLRELVSRETFDAWRNATEGAPTTTLQTIDAFVRIRCDLIGDDAVAEHMRAQRTQLRDNHALPAEAVREVQGMLERPRTIDLLPTALMWIACTDLLQVRSRLKLANVAVAASAALKYALQPGDVFSLEHDRDNRLVITTNLARADRGPVPQFAETMRLVEQRTQLREALGATSSHAIMVNEAGMPMGNQECAQALSRTQDQFGLPRFPWQRFRDFAAIRILLADPASLTVVADLLEYSDPAIVLLRYYELLPRETADLLRTAGQGGGSR